MAALRPGVASQRGAIWIVVAASAVAAAFADGVPTGVPLMDVVWRMVFAAGVTLCAASAARWSWIVVAGVASVAAVGGDNVVVAIGLVALALAVVAAVQRDGPVLLGVAAVALAAQVLLRLPTIGFTGATALIAGLAVVPVLGSAWLGSSRTVRRRVVWGVVVFGVVAVVALIPTVFSAVTAARETSVATRESRAWLDAAREGDQDAAVEHIEASGRSFASVEQATGEWWLWPARALPVVGPQLGAVHEVAASGHRITEAALPAAEVATPENLRLRNGQVDLALLDALGGPLLQTSTALSDAQSGLDDLNTTWLLPMLQTKVDEFGEQLDEAADDTELAVDTLEVAPRLLGGDGARTYLVLFASPAETRELGGFVGNAAIVTAENGHVELEEVLRSRDLNLETENLPDDQIAAIEGAGFPVRYVDYEPWRNWQNITGSPDFVAVADMVRALAPEAIGRPVDGVLYVDPEGLAGLLQLTGPVDVEGLDEQIGADNVTDFLLREQYVLYPEKADRVDFLETVARQTFELLTTSDLPGARKIGKALGPPVDGGHLKMWTFDPEEQAFFERLGLTGRLKRTEADDELLVTVANANPNKIDAYLHRSVSYDANLDRSTGEVTARVRVELENTAPTDLSDYVIGNQNDEPDGSNRTLVSLYTGLGVGMTSVDGEAVGFETAEEYGFRRAGVFVTVPAGGRTEIVFDLSGRARTPVAAGEYSIRVRTPALVFADRVTARLRAEGAQVGAPELSGPVRTVPAPELAPGFAAFDLAGTAVVTFPLGADP